jgi:Carbohydrate binding module (family 6)
MTALPSHLPRQRRPLVALAALLLLAGVLLAQPNAIAGPTAQASSWQLRWAPEANVDGLDAFEGVEDDRANSHPAGQPHIFVDGNNYRFNMHIVDRDIMTDRQRQEVKGMTSNGADLILLKGETWRWTYSMFIPTSLKATTTFSHIMQMKMPGTDSLPILTMSLQRENNVPKIELHVFQGDVIVGSTNLTPLQNKWIDMELEMTIGDAPNGKVHWVLHDGATTVIDVSRSGVDTWLDDRVRPKWGIYRSVQDTSGSLQNTFLLLTKMRAYQWTGTTQPPLSTKYEAEKATLSNAVVESEHAHFTGTGYVNYDNQTGSYVQFAVNSPAAAPATLTFRYANGTTTNRPMDIRVNGTVVAAGLAFNRTPAWDDWDTRTISVKLLAGNNTVRATATTSNGGPNLDNVEVQISAAPPPPPPPPTDYQAENATIVNGVVESNHLGFTGTGFVNYNNVTGSAVQFAVNMAQAGAATLVIRYSNGTTTSRPMDIAVNGVVVVHNQAFNSTGNWDTWATVTIPVTLTAGGNTIRATATTSNGGPNLDKITV